MHGESERMVYGVGWDFEMGLSSIEAGWTIKNSIRFQSRTYWWPEGKRFIWFRVMGNGIFSNNRLPFYIRPLICPFSHLHFLHSLFHHIPSPFWHSRERKPKKNPHLHIVFYIFSFFITPHSQLSYISRHSILGKVFFFSFSVGAGSVVTNPQFPHTHPITFSGRNAGVSIKIQICKNKIEGMGFRNVSRTQRRTNLGVFTRLRE